MTAMRDAMEKAGLMTPERRLYLAGAGSLQTFGSPTAALERFEAALADSPDLRRVLAMEYLDRLHKEMRTPDGGGHMTRDAHSVFAPAAPAPNGEVAGQSNIDAPESDAPSSPPLSGGAEDHISPDALGVRAQPPGSSRAGAGHQDDVAQLGSARPVRETDEGMEILTVPVIRDAGGHFLPQKEISSADRQAMVHVARFAAGSIFNRKIGTGQRVLGSLTKRELQVMNRATYIDRQVIKALISKVDWPSSINTTLNEAATEDEIKKIFEDVRLGLVKKGISPNAAIR